ncbi:hypothetical protein [Virgibacillus salexigens]|uniref:Uncharacterized protein n=1 Tax=Virgibacillus massiliensis TaxID=1462526 RepID=A0A024QI18_9BACI|nr:hypothetical protein [Virgibacillus massiliensis]CDQ41840.1 hypothetical protein BN990_04219 [Virgibacillus massiliensis]
MKKIFKRLFKKKDKWDLFQEANCKTLAVTADRGSGKSYNIAKKINKSEWNHVVLIGGTVTLNTRVYKDVFEEQGVNVIYSNSNTLCLDNGKRITFFGVNGDSHLVAGLSADAVIMEDIEFIDNSYFRKILKLSREILHKSEGPIYVVGGRVENDYQAFINNANLQMNIKRE